MLKKKLLLLTTFGIIIGYRETPFRTIPKFFDPVMLIASGTLFQLLIGVTMLVAFLYLVFSSIVYPYKEGYKVLIAIMIFFTISVVMEFANFNKFLAGEKIYFLVAVSLYFLNIVISLRQKNLNRQ